MRSTLAFIAIFILTGGAMAQESRADLFSQQPGRYQIVFGPLARADTFLLDTGTGKIWQLNKFPNLVDEPSAWVPMKRIDSDAQLYLFIREQGFKPKNSAKSAAPITMPAVRTPLQLNGR